MHRPARELLQRIRETRNRMDKKVFLRKEYGTMTEDSRSKDVISMLNGFTGDISKVVMFLSLREA
jgi:hypothetical protein